LNHGTDNISWRASMVSWQTAAISRRADTGSRGNIQFWCDVRVKHSGHAGDSDHGDMKVPIDRIC
jgi:hypothetical protein